MSCLFLACTSDVLTTSSLFLAEYNFRWGDAFHSGSLKAWDALLLDFVCLSFIRWGIAVFLALMKIWGSKGKLLPHFFFMALVSSVIYSIVKLIFSDWTNHDLVAEGFCTMAFSVFQAILVITLKPRSPAISKNIQNGDDGSIRNELAEALLGEEENGEKKDAIPKKVNLQRLLSLAREERGLIILATCALFLSALATMAVPRFIGILIDEVVEERNQKKLDRNCLYLLGIFLAGSAFTFIRGAVFNLAGEKLVARLRSKLFKSVVEQDTSFFDTQKTGELMNRLASDTTVVQNAVTVNVSMGLRSAATVVLSLCLLFATSWKLSLVMLAVVPLLVAFARLYGGYTRRLSKGYQDALAKASEVAQEALSNSRTVKSFSAECLEQANYSSMIVSSYKTGVKKSFAYGIFISVISLLAYGAMLTVLWYGGRLVMNNELSYGDLSAFLLYATYIATGLGTLSGLFSEFMSAVGASERVFALMDRAPGVPCEGGIQPSQMLGHITFEDVHFTYPSRPDTPVLNGLNLEIQPNQKVALVGSSGAGKSTVLSLLLRFYEPTSGRILIDGADLRGLDPAWLRSHVAVVQQEPVLFSGTVLDNICYGLAAQRARWLDHGGAGPDFGSTANALGLGGGRGVSVASLGEGEEQEKNAPPDIERIARLANCHDFISEFPDRYATRVGERGVRLSGGQKQRVAVARALALDPALLLLDEATSALDAASEHLVQQAIDRLAARRTVVVIAHRLSTVRDADKIVVLAPGGRVLGEGRHEELLSGCSAYRRLVKRQLQTSSEHQKEKEGEMGEGAADEDSDDAEEEERGVRS